MLPRSKVLTGLTALSFGVVIAAPRPAHAQSTGLIPLRVKVGALLASQNNTQDNAGTVIPVAEVDLHIPHFLGADYISLGIQSRAKSGGHLRVVPLTISKTFQPPNPVSLVTGYTYFGVGAGPYFLQGKRDGESNSKTTIGGFAQAGYQFPSKYFVEAKYQLVAGKSAGNSANGIVLFVGRSF